VIMRGLAQVPLFAGLPAAALQDVIQHAISCRTEKDSFIFHQGDPAEYLHVLAEGSVKLFQVTEEGQQVIVRVAGAWQMFGGVALLDEDTYPVSAQAAEACQGLHWSSAVLRDLLQRYPLISTNAMRWMAEHVRETQDMFRHLATERVEQRLARILLRLMRQLGTPREGGVLIDFPLTRQDLAEMGGTTLFTASRILSQWEKNGVVKSGRERVTVSDPVGLAGIAEDSA